MVFAIGMIAIHPFNLFPDNSKAQDTQIAQYKKCPRWESAPCLSHLNPSSFEIHAAHPTIS
jgi:hypothetical protein